jgi:SAM-dependent methyltransferase
MRRHNCPVCGSRKYRELWCIEKSPVLCNALFRSGAEARKAAMGGIELVQCHHCTHLFNTFFDPRKVVYTRDYNASLSCSPTYRSYAEKAAERLISQYDLRERQVIEIGCGDGYFADLLARNGQCRIKGYEPAAAEIRRGPGVGIVARSFSATEPTEEVSCVVARHVFEHLAEPMSMLNTIHQAVETECLVHLEVPNGEFLLSGISLWDIIYEHVSSFTPVSLRYLLTAAGFDVLFLAASFGEQYLVVEARKAYKGPVCSAEVPVRHRHQLLARGGLFRDSAVAKTLKIETQIEKAADNGDIITLWGAGSKGIALLNFPGFSSNIQYVVDSNQSKWGKFVPGTGHQILSPTELQDKCVDLILLVNGLYFKEIEGELSRLGIQATLEVVQ